MKVLIETPKYSFTKYVLDNGSFRIDFRSPLPTLFNYGIVKDVDGGDGMPQDVLVLGKRLSQGTELMVEKLGIVYFMDDGNTDDKIIAGRPTDVKRYVGYVILVFFQTYSIFKKIRTLILEKRLPKTSFLGFSLPVR